MHSKSHVHPLQKAVKAKHIALDIKSPKTIGKILPFTTTQNPNMALKKKSHSFHKVSLEYKDQIPWPHDIKKLTASFNPLAGTKEFFFI